MTFFNVFMEVSLITIQIILRKVLPLTKGMQIETIAKGPDGLGRYWVQQLEAESLGLHFIDMRDLRATLKITGRIDEIEISNTHDKYAPVTRRYVFLVYLTLLEETVEELDFPSVLRMNDQYIIVTNYITKERRSLHFTGETYKELFTQYALVNPEQPYVIQDAEGNVITDQIIKENPVDAEIRFKRGS